MKHNTFIYTDRGYDDTMVLLPGWACDYRIFDQLDCKYNYMMPEFLYPETIIDDLNSELESHHLNNITLLGFSLGGFEGIRYALKHSDLIDRLILIGVRHKYSSEEISLVKNNLNKNKNGSLMQFYKAFFYDQSKMSWFKHNLMRDYCEKFSLDHLLYTLDYLAECSITANDLKNVENCVIFHGIEDSIAPVSEIQELCKDADKELTLLENTGHAVFLEQDLIL